MAALMSRRRASAETGAELIEFALVLPVLLVIVGGIIDFGFLFQRYEVLTNAAREGARVAVLPGYTNADVTARVNQYLQAGGVPAGATITVGAAQNIPVGGGTCITVRPVTVTFPHQYTVLSPLLTLIGGTGLATTTLTATSSMRNEIGAGGC
jgi:Flp pilus assembly protein TadG